MGLKAFFKSNADYGADELNNIVKYLRTDGVYGEIADCLKASKGTGTVINIADGIGWVDGCSIEVSEGETLTLPTTSGKYYVYMQVETQSDHTTDATITYTTEEPENENCILASVVVASGAISTVTDARVNSQFKGITQITSVYPEWVAGDKIIFGDAESGSATSLTEKEIARYKVNNNGGLRLKYYLGLGTGNATGSQTAYCKIYKNDALAKTHSATSNMRDGGTQKTVDISGLTAGDEIVLKAYGSPAVRATVVEGLTFGINRISDTVAKL